MRAGRYTTQSATADALGAQPLAGRKSGTSRAEPASRRRRSGRRTSDRDALTERELEVLSLVADGLTNPEIADRLFLSRKTVGIHVSRVLAKLDAHTRGQAAAVARRRELID